MEKIITGAEEIAGTLKDYLHTRIESVKLGVAEKSSAVISNLVAGALVAAVFFFFLLFSGMALSFALALWLHATWAGFLITAFIYLLLGIICWKARARWIQLPVMNAIIRSLYKKEEGQKNE